MRITDRMRYNSTRGDLNRLHTRSSKIYQELSSGRRINRPSDDPFGALQATALSTHRRLLDQYSRNIDTARINLYAADNAMGQAVTMLTQARTLLITGVSVVGESETHAVMADSMAEIKEELFNLANGRVGDNFIFGGFQNTRKPYTQDEITGRISYRGDQGTMRIEVGEGALLDTALQGASAFGVGSTIATLANTGAYGEEPSLIGRYTGANDLDITLEAVSAGQVTYPLHPDDAAIAPAPVRFSMTTNGGAPDLFYSADDILINIKLYLA